MYGSLENYFKDGYNMNKTARLTNSINITGMKTFNKWGGISYKDILNIYPKELIEECWNTLGRQIIENYEMGKGTNIKGFGIFTFTNVEINLEGTTKEQQMNMKEI